MTSNELEQARERLKQSGISGIYDEFKDIPDAIDQMTMYIKEMEQENEEDVFTMDEDRQYLRVELSVRGKPETFERVTSVSIDGEYLNVHMDYEIRHIRAQEVGMIAMMIDPLIIKARPDESRSQG